MFRKREHPKNIGECWLEKFVAKHPGTKYIILFFIYESPMEWTISFHDIKLIGAFRDNAFHKRD